MMNSIDKPQVISSTKWRNILLSLFLLASSFTIMAQGDLILLQRRVVFEGSKNIAILDYGNMGKDTATYITSLMNLRMTEMGAFETINTPDSSQLFADQYIRIYPHNIEIAPNASQTMKIQLVNTRGLAPGEYRSHLYFRADQDKKSKSENEGEKKEVSVSVKTEFGIAIPIIIRIGESTTAVELEDVSLNNGELSFSILRTGNFSSYGHITATHVSSDGTETGVGGVMGVAVYTPGTKRICKLILENKENVNLVNGRLKVMYLQPKEEGGAILAEKEIQLN